MQLLLMVLDPDPPTMETSPKRTSGASGLAQDTHGQSALSTRRNETQLAVARPID